MVINSTQFSNTVARAWSYSGVCIIFFALFVTNVFQLMYVIPALNIFFTDLFYPESKVEGGKTETKIRKGLGA